MKTISDSNAVGDIFYIFVAALVVDFLTVIITKYPGPKPYFTVKALDDWYTRFGLTAVAADVLSVMIGVVMARYIFTAFGFSPSSILLFIAVLLIFQLCHDAFFFLAVIQPLKRGENTMIDVFKDYAIENGGKILVADALLVLGTAAGATLLKNLPFHLTATVGLVTAYALCFVTYTKATYSSRSTT
jgi:hypothetical protein